MSQLINAIKSDNLTIVNNLIKNKNYDPAAVDENRKNALMWAFEKGYWATAKSLILRDDSILGNVDNEGWTALLYACNFLCDEDGKTNINSLNNIEKLVIYLIESGKSNLGQANINGLTPLIYLIKCGYFDLALKIINTGESNPEQTYIHPSAAIDPNAKRKTAFDIAKEKLEETTTRTRWKGPIYKQKLINLVERLDPLRSEKNIATAKTLQLLSNTPRTNPINPPSKRVLPSDTVAKILSYAVEPDPTKPNPNTTTLGKGGKKTNSKNKKKSKTNKTNKTKFKSYKTKSKTNKTKCKSYNKRNSIHRK